MSFLIDILFYAGNIIKNKITKITKSSKSLLREKEGTRTQFGLKGCFHLAFLGVPQILRQQH